MSNDLGQELDRLAIMDLLIRYARSVDSHDFGAMRSCFADDLVFVNIGSPDAQHGGDTYTGVIRRLLVPFGATQHLLATRSSSSAATWRTSKPTCRRPTS